MQMATPSQSNLDDCRELIFKHFPSELTSQECCDFLSNLGATSTHVLGLANARQKHIIAEFPSVEYAWGIIRDLHQRPIADKRISVEFYRPTNVHGWRPTSSDDDSTASQTAFDSRTSCVESTTTVLAPKWDPSFPVPPNLRYKYPAPTNSILTNIVRCMVSCPALYTQVLHIMNRLHLPPPFADTDTFPGNLLVVVESDLITQTKSVLDQNPKAVGSEVNHFDHRSSDLGEQQQDEYGVAEEEMELSTSTESELDSADDTQTAHTVRPPRPVRRAKARLTTKGVGKPKRLRTTAVRSAPMDSADRVSCTSGPESRPAVSEVFEPVTHLSKLELHVPSVLTVSREPGGRHSGTVEHGGFGVIAAQKKVTAPVPDSASSTLPSKPPESSRVDLDSEFQLRKDSPSVVAPPVQPVPSPAHSDSEDSGDESNTESGSAPSGLSLSLTDLRLGRLTEEERQNYPVFAKGYQPGEPTSRLYIKNLATQTTTADLYRIFGAFQFGPVRDLQTRVRVRFADTARFSIRLLTEGRMKGQAFVSLPNELTALQALESTNGFLLHERPMVVQFARGAKARVDEKSLISTT